MSPKRKNPDLLKGTLDAMILRVLRETPEHGYGIARRIEAASSGVLGVEEGSLYPALHRLSQSGDIAGDWRVTDSGRRARYYRLTDQGAKRLKAEIEKWHRMSTAVSTVLGPTPGTLGEAPA